MYSLLHHKTITTDSWSQKPVDQQIFMIANEINRLKNGIQASLSFRDLQEIIERALELLDITIACNRGSFRKELLRFREIFGELYLFSEAKLHGLVPEIGQFYRVLLFLNSKTSGLN